MEMYRSGRYGKYNCKEYRLVKSEKLYIGLVGHDKKDIENGFTPYVRDESIFTKRVLKSEVTEVYSIRSKAIYRGYTFELVCCKQPMVALATCNDDIAKECGMEAVDRWDYRLWVHIDEVEIVEEKEKVSEF